MLDTQAEFLKKKASESSIPGAERGETKDGLGMCR